MSVRRLAPPEQQPKEFSFSKANLDWAKAQIAKYPEGRQQSAIIPLLWRAQEQAAGWLPEVASRYVADFLGMAHIRALEVATFYTMFNCRRSAKCMCSFAARHRAGCAAPTFWNTSAASALATRCTSLTTGKFSGRSRVLGRLRQRADGADRFRFLRGPYR